MVPTLLKKTAMCVFIASIFLSDATLGTTLNKLSYTRRGKRTVAGNQINNDLSEYNNEVDANLLQYTPSAPNPEDVNCYVEILVSKRVGGRCVSLGSLTWGCQAGIYLAFSSACQNIARSTIEPPSQAVNSTGSRTRGPFRGSRRLPRT